MDNLVTLSCPNCGGKLEITQDIERLACPYCGTEHIVQRDVGAISLKPVLEEIQAVKESVDRAAIASQRTADELALKRVEKERTKLQSWADARLNDIAKARMTTRNNQNLGILLFLIFGFLSGFSFTSIALSPLLAISNSDFGTSKLSGQVSCFAGSIFLAVVGGVLIYYAREQRNSLDQQETIVRTKLQDIQEQEATIRKRLDALRKLRQQRGSARPLG